MHLADCVIVTKDNRLLLQMRPADWKKHAGVVNLFGGHVEEGEAVIQALIRELAEETGAQAQERDILFIGAVSESFTSHTELVHIHFWHDKNATITGCYEAEAVMYDKLDEALAHPRLMDYARWALEECQKRNLFPVSA